MADDETVELKPLGRIADIRGRTILLADSLDAQRFRRGDTLATSYVSHCLYPDVLPIPLRNGRVVVTDVDDMTGEVECDRDVWSSIVGACKGEYGDWIYRVEVTAAGAPVDLVSVQHYPARHA